MMSRRASRWIAVATAFLCGCAATRQYPAPPPVASATLAEAGESAATSQSQRFPASEATPVIPRNVLVLSGGGMCGAYTAGVLKGWTASGARPCFDVVTGISTGALIAPFAFLGPEYDPELERLYTSTRQANIFRPRLLWLDSVVSSEPLEQQIAAGVTPEVLRKIADAHRQGRRLYVGTTNLDTKRLVVWDLGAIAARNSPESKTLFQKVLLASCSIPGLLPPVPIDVEIDGRRFTELHVDGGVTACAFLQPAMLGIRSNGAPPEGAPITLHVVVAGRLQPASEPAKRQLFSVAAESMSALLQVKSEGELIKLFMLARYAQADFNLAGVPDDCLTSGSSMSFDQQSMLALFDAGYRGGKDGTAWHSSPPGLQDEATATPRRGTRFVAVGGSPRPNVWTPEKIRITLDRNNPSPGP